MARILEAQALDRKLWENAKRFIQPGWYFLENTNLGKPQDFDKAQLRVLILFLSPGETRAVSSTDLALVSIFKQTLGEEGFIDICFLPLKENIKTLDGLGLPWAFGGLSHHAMHDFDVVLVSNSIIEEKYNLLPLLANSDFPIWSTERDNRPDLPFLLLGGAGASEAEPLYGKSLDGKNQSLVDASYVGYAEPYLPQVFKHFLKLKKAGTLKDKQATVKSLYKFPCIYNPRAYEHIYEADNWTIKEIKKVDPDAPDKVKFAHQTKETLDTVAGFECKLLYNNGNYDACDIQISAGCSGGRVCSFCHEAHSQSWREKSLEKILKEMDAARFCSFATTESNYSFNTNFHPYYEDIMYAVALKFPRITVIGMRADGIAARPDFLKMDKYLGLQKLTLGVEGVSERLRNGYLNKSLPRQVLLDALKAIFQARFMQTKLYFILTGREENQDWDDCIQLLKDAIKVRDECGGNTAFRLTFSMLCHYPHTAIAWDERKTVLHAIEGGRINYFIEKTKELGISVRFTSRGRGIAFQQMNIDLGRPFTAIFERLWRDQKWVWYRNTPDPIVEEIFSLLKDHKLPDYKKIFAQRPYTWIFPSQTVHVKSDKWLIQASKECNAYKGKNYCLQTQAKPESAGCDGCGLCANKKEIESVVKHAPHLATKTVDDVIVALAQNKAKYRYRFVFSAPTRYAFLHKRPLAHYYMTQAVPEEFKQHVYGVAADSDPARDTQHPAFQYIYSGQFFFDLMTREPLPELKTPKDTILSLNSVKQVPMNYDVKYTDYQISAVEVNLNDRLIELLRDSAKAKMFPYMEDDFPLVWGLEKVDYQPMLRRSTTTSLVVVHPMRANLIKWLANLTGAGYQRVIEEQLIGINHLVYLRPSQGLKCKVCEKEGVINLATGTETGFCIEHLRNLLYKAIFEGK